MRNIAEYPVTFEETIQVLEREIEEEVDSKRIGSIEPHLKSLLVDFLKQNQVIFEAHLQNYTNTLLEVDVGESSGC